ncbi:thiamine-phosphate kinase [Halopenitus malekzadehii]|uniref:Thiamine-monophosphate kinase n=1 Tax=Halopenitus malekzadehii TaxID=1267564 RepID=A0A1H6IGZ9_9EURY|nr:thiamine-phosphate kinase [Halopenitus malekzadehii]SEH47174.1 thiamine-phosphate kinase [Halopenitus malekzadehii]
MDEREALSRIAASLPDAGDDAAVVGSTVITTDMLHDRTDFPAGTTRYTAGWRAVGASLSDVAAMGADATAAVAVYADVEFDPATFEAFIDGAVDVCESVGARYVGGDLDQHTEFTTATTAIGETDAPVRRSGARPGETVCVTGTLGRSAAALELFEAEERLERANELFRFPPRVEAGRTLTAHATAMMDSSDGLARSLHQLAAASDVGVEIDRPAVPIDPAVDDVTDTPEDRWRAGTRFGEDFELVCTIPETALETAIDRCPVDLTRIGSVVPADRGVSVDGDPLPDRGYTHGDERA